MADWTIKIPHFRNEFYGILEKVQRLYIARMASPDEASPASPKMEIVRCELCKETTLESPGAPMNDPYVEPAASAVTTLPTLVIRGELGETIAKATRQRIPRRSNDLMIETELFLQHYCSVDF